MAAQTVINVKLQEDSEVLDEVVVVGYGSQKKETLTGAVTVVSDKMLKNKGTMSSPLQAMQGQVPGVTITRNSAAPGDESWGLKLRGSVSANNAEPLIVIDGVAYDGVNALRNINLLIFSLSISERCIGCYLWFPGCRWCGIGNH